MCSAWSCSVKVAAAASAWIALLCLPAQRAEALSAAEAYPAPPGTRLVVASDASAATDAIERLERVGYRVAVALPPRLYYVIPPRYLAPLPPGFEMPDAAPAGGSGLAPRLDGSGGVGDASQGAPSAPSGGADPFGGRPDLLEPLQAPSRARGAPERVSGGHGLFFGTRWGDTSEFMAGRVAVGVLLPESDGSVDSNLFDWTPTLRDSVVRSTITGLARWSTRAATRGIPLTFVLEVHPALATRYEPIHRTTAEEALWISDVLAPLLGHDGGAADLAYEYVNEMRARLGAQWGYVIFGVQNADSLHAAFPDGYIAHSRLGGPWIVLPLNNLNTKSARLDYYVEHETTHMFWALDEYPANGAWWFCTLTTGYFAYPNSNSELPSPIYCVGPDGHVQCVMDGNYPGVVCPFTEGQIGWADLDGSGTPDILETRPAVTPDSTRFHAAAGEARSLGGLAHEAAAPNRNPYHFGAGDSISVATIDSVWMRLDGGAWASLPPTDGLYNTGQERFTGDVAGLPAGNHLVEWLAWNSNGMSGKTPASAILEVLGSPAATGTDGAPWSGPPSLVAGPSPAGGPVTFALRARPGSRGRARVFDARGRLAWSTTLDVPPSGQLRWTWNGVARDGRRPSSGVYFVAVDVGGERVSRRVVLLR